MTFVLKLVIGVPDVISVSFTQVWINMALKVVASDLSSNIDAVSNLDPRITFNSRMTVCQLRKYGEVFNNLLAGQNQITEDTKKNLMEELISVCKV